MAGAIHQCLYTASKMAKRLHYATLPSIYFRIWEGVATIAREQKRYCKVSLFHCATLPSGSECREKYNHTYSEYHLNMVYALLKAAITSYGEANDEDGFDEAWTQHVIYVKLYCSFGYLFLIVFSTLLLTTTSLLSLILRQSNSWRPMYLSPLPGKSYRSKTSLIGASRPLH